MPSRKRAKGKAGMKAREGGASRSQLVCSHGFEPTSEDELLILKSFYLAWKSQLESGSNKGILYYAARAVEKTLNAHPKLLNDDASRESMIKCLVHLGAEELLEKDTVTVVKPFRPPAMICYACFAVMLETYDPLVHSTAEILTNSIHTVHLLAENLDALQGCEKSITRFFHSRIPCSCLDEKAVKAESQHRTGLCNNCDGRFEQRALLVCNRCKIAQYCSRKCQVEDWQNHKGRCKIVKQQNTWLNLRMNARGL